ncbi:MAG: diacylglycerol kinase family lipid kinase, partial [Clostridia bacterium]|nr:diacylglycerol kinase family lipid kinase [Clostridia bacterium]
MRHIFILNPNAGKGTQLASVRAKIEQLTCDREIYETGGHADATRYVRACCEKYSEPIRFYACGGDGTIKEVAEGILGQAHASMSCLPIGSGNDFVKCFGSADSFLNVEALTKAGASDTDIICIHPENHADTYSLNVCNFGFEACVAQCMNRVRRWPLLGGKNAYTTGIVYALFRAMKNRGDIYADGEKLNESGNY